MINKFLSFFGLSLVINNKLNFDNIYKKLIKVDPLIIDVGSKNGESVKRFSKIFKNFQCHCFEPSPSFKNLYASYKNHKNIFLSNFGLSNKEEVKDFYILHQIGMSTLNKIDIKSKSLINKATYRGVKPEEFIKEKIKVKLFQLDKYIKKNKITKASILKIDVEGHESEVIIGAIDSIKKNVFDFIELEINLSNFYKKKINFLNIERFLIPNGYKFYGIDRAGNLNIYPNFTVNVLYISKRLDGVI